MTFSYPRLCKGVVSGDIRFLGDPDFFVHATAVSSLIGILGWLMISRILLVVRP